MASYIVGGGFAALAVQALLPDAILISPIDPHATLRSYGFLRRRNFELNKLFAKRSCSLGAFLYQGAAKLHDRLILGGNSGVWGGFIDISKVSDASRLSLENMGIRFSRLGSRLTGSSSQNKDYRQLQGLDGRVLDASRHLRIGHDAYLRRVADVGDLELIERIKEVTSLKSLELSADDRVYLAIGVVQILDLLMHSGRLCDGDEIELDEYGMSFSIALRRKEIGSFEREFSDIDYFPTGVIAHGLGLQRHFRQLEIFNVLGVVMKQQFFHANQTARFGLKNDAFIDKTRNVGFGASIHYCNLRINGNPISDFISKAWPQFSVVGMAAVEQSEPGPISNDILRCALSAVHNEQ